MKEITVKIPDDDYEWLLNKAKTALENYREAGKEVVLTPDKVVSNALKLRAVGVIATQLNIFVEQSKRALEQSKGVSV